MYGTSTKRLVTVHESLDPLVAVSRSKTPRSGASGRLTLVVSDGRPEDIPAPGPPVVLPV